MARDMNLLAFGRMDSNAKLAKRMGAACDEHGYTGRLLTFSLPAGFTCPAALDCESRADRDTGRITDGAHTQFRCYAASQESRRGSVRQSRWHNFDLLRQVYASTPGDSGDKANAMASLILESIRAASGRQGTACVRIHVSGDFYNRAYLTAWRMVAARMTSTLFYAYTKAAVPHMASLARGDAASFDESNLRFIASRGGRYDHLIDEYQLREARVVYSMDEARALGLQIDDDDTVAAFGDDSFALLIHGTQPAGSVAAKSLAALKLHPVD